jgi:hypothetical protein
MRRAHTHEPCTGRHAYGGVSSSLSEPARSLLIHRELRCIRSLDLGKRPELIQTGAAEDVIHEPLLDSARATAWRSSAAMSAATSNVGGGRDGAGTYAGAVDQRRSLCPEMLRRGSELLVDANGAR